MRSGFASRVVLGAIATLIAAIALTGTASATSSGVMAWGDNYFGELGTGGFHAHDVPVTLREPLGVTGVSAGGDFSLALLESHKVQSWGDDVYGQLGNGTHGGESTTAGEVHGLSEVKAISAGAAHSLALLKSGKVKAWGLNSEGELGVGGTAEHDEPAELGSLSNVTAVSASGAYSAGLTSVSLALLESKHVMAWGSNEFGQLGTGTTTGPEECVEKRACSTEPTEVKGLEGVVAIAAGPEHELALLSNGKVMAWGDNASGQLGDGTTTTRTEPVLVKGLGGVVAIAAGWEFSLALLENGKVMAWGNNLNGELGDGTTEERHEPVEVSGLTEEVTAISADEEHSLALLRNGTVESWGANVEGDLGVGTYNGPEKCGSEPCSRKAVPVSELTGEVAGISAGEEHSLAYGPAGPVVKKVHPTSGPPSGGTEVTITGYHFMNVTKVKFGANEASSFEVRSETEIVAVAPAGSGKVGVTVTDEHGTIPTSPKTGPKYRYATIEAPEFGRCTKVTEGPGEYSNASCTATSSEGSYKWTPGVEKKRFSLSAGESTLETPEKAKVTCKGGSGSGEYVSAKEVTVTSIKLTGCEHAGAKCTSAGAGEGELVTSALEGEVGWRSKSGGTVALDLSPGEEADFADGKCGEASLVVRGSVIANLTTDEMLTSTPWAFTQSGGKQKPEHLQGGETDVLEMSLAGAKAEQAGLALTLTQTNEEKVEVNAAI